MRMKLCSADSLETTVRSVDHAVAFELNGLVVSVLRAWPARSFVPVDKLV